MDNKKGSNYSIKLNYLFSRNPCIVHSKIFDFSETGQIGDTINGIMGPFIAIAAVLLTFAAFYIQKEANDIQTETINAQTKQEEIQKIESRLFEFTQKAPSIFSAAPSLSNQSHFLYRVQKTLKSFQKSDNNKWNSFLLCDIMS